MSKRNYILRKPQQLGNPFPDTINSQAHLALYLTAGTTVVAALPYASTEHPTLSPHPAPPEQNQVKQMKKGKKRKLQTGCKS
jgi:hypothetical protein